MRSLRHSRRHGFILVCFLCFGLQAGGALAETTSDKSGSDNSEQAKEYSDAAKKSKNAAIADGISAGVWAASGIYCGINCVDYIANKNAREGVLKTMENTQKTSQKESLECLKPLYPPQIPKTIDGNVKSAAARTETSASAVDTAYRYADADAKRGEAVRALASKGQAGSSGGGQNGPEEQLDTAAEKYLTDVSAVVKALEAAATQHSKYASLALQNGAAVCKYATIGFDACMEAVYIPAQKADDQAALACSNAAKTISAAAEKIPAAIENHKSFASRIKQRGTYCAVGTGIAAAADLGLSAGLAKDAKQGMMGLIGLAPGAAMAANYVMKGSQATTTKVAGWSSCAGTGIGLALGAVKTAAAIKMNKSAKENEKKGKELQSDLGGAGAFFAKYLGWPVRGSLFGYLSSCFVPEAHAAGYSASSRSADFSICGSSSKALECVLSADPLLAQTFQSNPNRLDGHLRRIESELGLGRGEVLSGNPMAPERVGQLMGRGDPQLSMGFARVYRDLVDKALNSEGLSSGDLGQSPASSYQNMPYQNMPAASLPNAGGDYQQPQVAQPEPAQPAAADRQTASVTYSAPDGVVVDSSVSIFEIVSQRYKASRGEVQNLEWAVPENRLRHGLSRE